MGISIFPFWPLGKFEAGRGDGAGMKLRDPKMILDPLQERRPLGIMYHV